MKGELIFMFVVIISITYMVIDLIWSYKKKQAKEAKDALDYIFGRGIWKQQDKDE